MCSVWGGGSDSGASPWAGSREAQGNRGQRAHTEEGQGARPRFRRLKTRAGPGSPQRALGTCPTWTCPGVLGTEGLQLKQRPNSENRLTCSCPRGDLTLWPLCRSRVPSAARPAAPRRAHAAGHRGTARHTFSEGGAGAHPP